MICGGLKFGLLRQLTCVFGRIESLVEASSKLISFLYMKVNPKFGFLYYMLVLDLEEVSVQIFSHDKSYWDFDVFVLPSTYCCFSLWIDTFLGYVLFNAFILFTIQFLYRFNWRERNPRKTEVWGSEVMNTNCVDLVDYLIIILIKSHLHSCM